MFGGFLKVLGRQKQPPMYKQLEAFGEEVKGQKYHTDRGDFFRYASKELKLRPGDLSKEFAKLARGIGRLNFDEYVLFRLFDVSDFSLAEKQQFLSGSWMWRIATQINDMSWQIVTEDKYLSYAALRQLQLPTPETLAVIDTSARSYGATTTLRSAADLGAFLGSAGAYPIFAKPNHALGSFGVMLITGFEAGRLTLEGEEPLTLEEGFAALTKGGAFLLQRVVQNHPDVQALSAHLSTIRLTNFIGSEGLITPSALIKLTASGSVADNYWREGNMMADIDMESGKIRRAVRGKGVDLEILTAHPETGEAMVGRQLPYWKEVLELNERCAYCFAPIKFQSLDIAITPNGPLIVEINTGGAFDLPQLASGRGLLTPEVRAFLVDNGMTAFARS